MPTRFYVLAVLWTIAVAAASPPVVESLDRRGWTVVVPGLSVTGSEIVQMAGIVLVGLAILRLVHRRGSAG